MTGSTQPLARDDIAQRELIESIARATRAIEQETRDLRATVDIDYEAHRRSKDMSLLDLSRRSRIPPGPTPGPEARSALIRLREAVIENQAVLKTRLAAARTIAEAMMRIIADEESDRTYSRHVGRRADQR